MLRHVLVVSAVTLIAACSSSTSHTGAAGAGGTDAGVEAGTDAAAGGGGRAEAGADAALDAPDSSIDASGGAAGNGGAGASADASTDADASADADASITDSGASDADAAVDYDAEPVDGSSCNAVLQQHPIEGFLHVPPCSPVSYVSNPPSSGNHYPIWADYKTYTEPVPRGFWVHNLEHGAVVITYNCPGGCSSDVAQAQSTIDSYTDAACLASGVPRRIVMTPDPLLDVRWAASAWGWTLKASCFEPAVFLKFIEDHEGHGREDVCSGDWDFQPDGGPLVLPCSDAGLDGG